MKYKSKIDDKIVDAYQFSNKIGEDTRPKWIMVAVQMGLITYVPRGNAEPFLIVNSNGEDKTAHIDDWIIKHNGILNVVKIEDFILNYETTNDN
jgi:hypothetical protein